MKPRENACEVRIRVANDEDARRITAILSALNYVVVRELDGTNVRQHLALNVDTLARKYKFTEREREIVQPMVLEGALFQTIAEKLGISRATVKWHAKNILAKTSTTNREDLMRLAITVVQSAP